MTLVPKVFSMVFKYLVDLLASLSVKSISKLHFFLENASKGNCKQLSTPMVVNSKVHISDSTVFHDATYIKNYWSLTIRRMYASQHCLCHQQVLPIFA